LGRIRVLDDLLVNRIAAGEVVERPASVVKELVENALDAGASIVEVELEAGGRRRIRVRDDGCGMDRDDAVLALERHATSKVGRQDDLTAIATLGFRGEALPSIAAVSRFRLRTATADGNGTEVEAAAGRIVAVREVGLPRGTTVEVDRLFYNVPARRKFLRTDNTELAHSVRLVTRFALAYPDVRFRLTHGSRVLVEAPRAAEAGERLRQLLGGVSGKGLVPLGLERDGVRVHGWAGRPVDARPRRDAQHLFVNGRIVQDRVLTHAVTAAYGNTVPKGLHTAVVLFVELDRGEVDVNVHPQKTEVRFRHRAAVHDVARDAVRAALSREASVPELSDLRQGAWSIAEPRPTPATDVRRHLLARDRVAIEPSDPGPPRDAGSEGDRSRRDLGATESTGDLLGEGAGEGPVRPAVALGQIRDSYVIARDHDGLVLVDQHAAHERVLFERFLRSAEENRVSVQRLAFPVVVELAPHEMPVLEDEHEEMGRLGFVLEPFGENAVRIDAVPALFSGVDPETLFREMLGEAGRARSAAAASGPIRHRLITTAACKAAIKIRRPMTLSEMQALLDDLACVANPTTCPHGRPALFRLTLREIERTFRRA
jgi:DNA mismatch repair protein MutL